jgi:transcriptional regulator with XRE-family HTH domain
MMLYSSSDYKKSGATLQCAMPQKPRFKLPAVSQMESMGQRLTRFRKARGLTQIELAGQLGITQSLLSSYERDRLKLSAEMAMHFAQALNVGGDELLGLNAGRRKAAAKKENGEMSLKLVRRLKGIEQLPQTKQKALLSMIDSVLKSAER